MTIDVKQLIASLKEELRTCNREVRELRKTNEKLTKKVDKIKPKKKRPPTEQNIAIGKIMKTAAVAKLEPKERMKEANRIYRESKEA